MIAAMQQGAEKGRGRVEIVEIDARSAGQRIDNFLRRVMKGVPATRIYRSIRKGEVRVNGSRTKPDYRLMEGDAVRIPPLRRANPTGVPGELPERLRSRLHQPLYEDGELMILDKPAGLAVHGGSGLDYGLIEALRALRPAAPFLELVHRLDRETSGCLLVAKSRRVLLALHDQLRAHDKGAGGVQKRYLALLVGAWQGGRREISAPLRRIRGQNGQRRVVVDPEGQATRSVFEPVRRFEAATLARIDLLTGRMHQARAHAAIAGCPVAGDARYGDWKTNRELRKLGLRRMFLHAESLGFSHPVSGEKIEVAAELPPELETVLDKLQGAV